VASTILGLALDIDNSACGKVSESARPEFATAATAPYLRVRTHRVGGLRFTISNYGEFGSESRVLKDPCTNQPAPSLEFPSGSGVEHLFLGGVWIGAVRNGDTLVSVGADGWYPAGELNPESYPEGEIAERTTRTVLRQEPGSACPDAYYNADAISEQDLIAQYMDTAKAGVLVPMDPVDMRYHIPLDVKIIQSTYSWSSSFMEGFILGELQITNIGVGPLTDVYIGLLMDQDIAHMSTSNGHTDDIAGFVGSTPFPVMVWLHPPTLLAW
jgi:hypothetical protein